MTKVISEHVSSSAGLHVSLAFAPLRSQHTDVSQQRRIYHFCGIRAKLRVLIDQSLAFVDHFYLESRRPTLTNLRPAVLCSTVLAFTCEFAERWIALILANPDHVLDQIVQVLLHLNQPLWKTFLMKW